MLLLSPSDQPHNTSDLRRNLLQFGDASSKASSYIDTHYSNVLDKCRTLPTPEEILICLLREMERLNDTQSVIQPSTQITTTVNSSIPDPTTTFDSFCKQYADIIQSNEGESQYYTNLSQQLSQLQEDKLTELKKLKHLFCVPLSQDSNKLNTDFDEDIDGFSFDNDDTHLKHVLTSTFHSDKPTTPFRQSSESEQLYHFT